MRRSCRTTVAAGFWRVGARPLPAASEAARLLCWHPLQDTSRAGWSSRDGSGTSHPGLGPFFCYFGGKWRAAPLYPPPRYGRIIEPFAGAAGYATRYADRKVTLVELDPLIAALWRYLIRVRPAEILSIPAVVTGSADDLPVCEEARWLVGFWLNKGVSHPRKTPSKWMRADTRPTSYWGTTVRQRIASQVDAIRHWRVVEGSYEEAPDREATWFIDPPYQLAGKHYRSQVDDYRALAHWCRNRRGQVMVCENQGATWLPFEPFRRIRSTSGPHGKTFSTEVLWSGGRTRHVDEHEFCRLAVELGLRQATEILDRIRAAAASVG